MTNKYYIRIMSVDPNDHSEDPHQKYGIYVDASSEKEAVEKAQKEFSKKGLPIFWTKCIGTIDQDGNII